MSLGDMLPGLHVLNALFVQDKRTDLPRQEFLQLHPGDFVLSIRRKERFLLLKPFTIATKLAPIYKCAVGSSAQSCFLTAFSACPEIWLVHAREGNLKVSVGSGWSELDILYGRVNINQATGESALDHRCLSTYWPILKMAGVSLTKCFAHQKQRNEPSQLCGLLLPPKNRKKSPKVRLVLKVKICVTLVHWKAP